VAQRFREPTPAEVAMFHRALHALRSIGSRSTGKLHAELCPGQEMSRNDFEAVLGAMGRAGLVEQQDAVFEKDGKQIPYQLVRLTREGRLIDEKTAVEFLMKETAALAKRDRKQTRSAKVKSKVKKAPTAVKASAQEIAGDSRVEAALRAWRLNEAKRLGVPAFRIFNDRVLRDLVDERPSSDQDLLAISGIGTNMVKRYGAAIYRIVGRNADGARE
jgi:superfamily II DNA helicase RecQ